MSLEGRVSQQLLISTVMSLKVISLNDTEMMENQETTVQQEAQNHHKRQLTMLLALSILLLRVCVMTLKSPFGRNFMKKEILLQLMILPNAVFTEI